MFNALTTKIQGLLILETKIYHDDRGCFLETYHQKKFEDCGIKDPFVQTNLSVSKKNVLRGLHLQLSKPQGKLVSVIVGEAFDVAVDVRTDSPTFGQWEAVVLRGGEGRFFYLPPGMAHGFVALSDQVVFEYQCQALYDPTDEATLRYDDPSIGIRWPVPNPILSNKDKAGLSLDVIREKLKGFAPKSSL